MVWGARVGLDSPHAMCSGALVALTSPMASAWHHNVCVDGDVQPNPGPVDNNGVPVDEGAAFLLANQQAQFVALADSSSAQAIEGKDVGHGRRKRPAEYTTRA